jgi:hypothetical protein
VFSNSCSLISISESGTKDECCESESDWPQYELGPQEGGDKLGKSCKYAMVPSDNCVLKSMSGLLECPDADESILGSDPMKTFV